MTRRTPAPLIPGPRTSDERLPDARTADAREADARTADARRAAARKAGARRSAARRSGAAARPRPVPPPRDRVLLTALWQILVSMGGPFVPLLPPEVDDDGYDSGWSDRR